MDERVVRWVAKTERMPEAGDADAQGCVLIWDENNGVMVAGILSVIMDHLMKLTGYLDEETLYV